MFRFRAHRRRLVAGILLLSVAVSGLVTAAADAAVTTTVVDGDARFEVLSPTLVRLEYAGDGGFQDGTTFTAVNRNFAPAAYTTDVTSDGYREIRTSGLTLRYKQGSGPFTAANLSVKLTGTGVSAAPAFPSYCAVGNACEAENDLFTGRAAVAYDHSGHTGSGFVAGFEQSGAGLAQDVSAVPAGGSYRLQVRYANGGSSTATLSTTVNGSDGPALRFPSTTSWDTWSTTSATVDLTAGTNVLSVVQKATDTGRVNIDSLAVTPVATTAYPPASTALITTGYGAGPASVLGGWYRSLDNPAALPVPEHPGILDRDGWYLLDDTRTALLGSAHQVTDRPAHVAQPYQDGYFFGYGQDYRQGLSDLNALTGGTALLPQSAYGVWYSRYYAYSAADYQNTLLPQFRSSHTPLDWLVVDTDWKAPNNWNGWNWNTGQFPDPRGFLDWTRQQGLAVAMNIHPTIDKNDPQFAATNTASGGLAPDGGNTYKFDWSNPKQLAAYLALHKPFEQQGNREWWLDACCDSSSASDPHIAADNLINQAYADEGTARGLRGFSFARIGASTPNGYSSNYPVGPWSERRNTLQFTGDTPATWDMLSYEVRFTADEAAAGLSNVSHDIGSYHGGHLADDLYARWMQFGVFQPIDRMHSDHGDRLPWNYGEAAAASAESSLRLREALVPYTYTLAREANTTGVPIVRPMYLNYPAGDAAYTATGEYLYGDNVLVAPITTPNDANGNGSTSVWVPPGSWTDYFTGSTYTGPATVTLTAPLSRMPVLVKAGGILPTRTEYTDNQAQSPLTKLTVNVAAGADGSFSLYSDAGEGNDYKSGSSTSAPLSWSDAGRTLTIGAQSGAGYSGAPTSRAYTLRLSNSAAPTAVFLDGVQVPETDWSWNANRRTVTVTTAELSLSSAHTVALTGSAGANPAAGEVLGAGGQCLDVEGGDTTDGTALQLWGCNHTAAQTFGHPADGTLRVLGKCVTVDGGATGNNTQVNLAGCTGAASQTWVHRTNGALVNTGSSRCLDVPGDSAARLQIYDCNGSAGQAWKLPPGPLTGPGGLCADVANADPAPTTPVQLWGCNATDAQRISAPGDQTLHVLGKCLDVTSGGTANGTRIQLWDCNGTGSQTWTSRADGTLFNPQSGRCLDDNGNQQQPGDVLQIWDCNGTPAQQFTLS